MVKLVPVPVPVTVAPESTPFTKTLMPVTSTGLPALEAAEFKVIVVDVEAVDAWALAFAGESTLKTELGLMVTDVAPRVLGDDDLPGE